MKYIYIIAVIILVGILLYKYRKEGLSTSHATTYCDRWCYGNSNCITNCLNVLNCENTCLNACDNTCQNTCQNTCKQKCVNKGPQCLIGCYENCPVQCYEYCQPQCNPGMRNSKCPNLPPRPTN